MDLANDVVIRYSLERHASGVTRLRIGGELDACTALDLEAGLNSRQADLSGRLVLDLEELEFIDSSGIRLLIMLLNRRGHPGDVVMLRPRPGSARRALELVGFSRIVPAVDDLSAAFRDTAA